MGNDCGRFKRDNISVLSDRLGIGFEVLLLKIETAAIGRRGFTVVWQNTLIYVSAVGILWLGLSFQRGKSRVTPSKFS
jgi:hypothetical protein